MALLWAGLALLAAAAGLPALLRATRAAPAPVGGTPSRHDERDIIYVRQKLRAGTPVYDEYYAAHPEKKEADDRFRAEPGLLSPDARMADTFVYRSVRGSLNTLYALLKERDGEHFPEKRFEYDPARMSEALKGWCRQFGALSAGVCLLEEHHKYTHHGYYELRGVPVDLPHKFVIVFTQEMGLEATLCAPRAPVWLETARQYESGANVATQLAVMIRHMGWPAKAHYFDNYDLILPLAARDAGLGEIGRIGILMTPGAGPRVRLAAVTTDMPLLPDPPRRDQAMLDFCAGCRKCADGCPARAISSGPPEEDGASVHWKINHEACYTYWARTGNPCGRCMAVCPLSHPGNLMARVPWETARASRLFHRTALAWDDRTYGRLASPRPAPDWMRVTMDRPGKSVDGEDAP